MLQNVACRCFFASSTLRPKARRDNAQEFPIPITKLTANFLSHRATDTERNVSIYFQFHATTFFSFFFFISNRQFVAAFRHRRQHAAVDPAADRLPDGLRRDGALGDADDVSASRYHVAGAHRAVHEAADNHAAGLEE